MAFDTVTGTVSSTGPSSDVTAILACLRSLLDAIPTKDASKMLACCIPNGGAASMRGDALLVHTIENLLTAIPLIPGDIFETFIDPEVKVYKNLAMVGNLPSSSLNRGRPREMVLTLLCTGMGKERSEG